MSEYLFQRSLGPEVSSGAVEDDFENTQREAAQRKNAQIQYKMHDELKKFDSEYFTLKKNFSPAEYTNFKDWKQAFEKQTELPQRIHLLRSIPFSENPEAAFEFLFGENGVFDQVQNQSDQVLQKFYTDQPHNASDFIAEFLTFQYTLLTLAYEKNKKVREQLFSAFALKFIDRYEEIRKTQLFFIHKKLSYPHSQMAEDGYERIFGVFLPGNEFVKLAHEILYEVPKIFSDKKESIHIILKMVTEMEAADLCEVAARFLSHIDATLAAETFCSHIQDIHKSKEQKKKLGDVLYRLELGKPVKVTHQTVEYLQKKYHLKGKLASQAVSAIRIDSNGKLGLLDENETLIGYIEFGNFESNEEKDAFIFEISTEMLLLETSITEDTKSTQEKEKNEFLKNYYQDFYCKFNTTETGVYLNNLSLPEQFHFYQFLKNNKNEERTNKVKYSAKEFGYPFVKAFLALQFDSAAAEKILSLIEKYKSGVLSKKDVEMIFLRYEQLFERAKNIDEELENFFVTPKNISSFDRKGATAEIMKRAGTLFATISAEDETPQESIQDLLNKTDADLTIFSSLFKIAVKENGGKVEYADIQGLDFHEESLESIRKNPDLLTKMLHIIKENRKDRGEQAMNAAGKDFETFLSENDGTVYLLHKNGELLSFIIFSPLPSEKQTSKPHKIARSFNVNTSYRGSGIGESMMTHTLQKESEMAVLHAVVKPDIDVRRRYIEDVGFTITGVDENYSGSNSPMLTIVCDREKRFSTRTFTTKECVELYDTQKSTDLDTLLEKNEPIIVVSIDTKNISDFSNRVKKLSQQGYVGTREVTPSFAKKSTSLFVFQLDSSAKYVESVIQIAA